MELVKAFNTTSLAAAAAISVQTSVTSIVGGYVHAFFCLACPKSTGGSCLF